MSIEERYQNIMSIMTIAFPPCGIPDPLEYPKISAYISTPNTAFYIYRQDPITYKNVFSNVLSEFESAESLVVMKLYGE